MKNSLFSLSYAQERTAFSILSTANNGYRPVPTFKSSIQCTIKYHWYRVLKLPGYASMLSISLSKNCV